VDRAQPRLVGVIAERLDARRDVEAAAVAQSPQPLFRLEDGKRAFDRVVAFSAARDPFHHVEHLVEADGEIRIVEGDG
jgi:hypothetical protein